jgi:hypothetical protein
MDRIKKYQENIIQFLEKYAQRKYANMPEVENQVIADLERNHFSLMSVGWHNDDFVHSCVFHFDIKDGKIWIQANWTEIDVAEKLVEMGVPKSDIVLGFQPPYARPLSGYAAA